MFEHKSARGLELSKTSWLSMLLTLRRCQSWQTHFKSVSIFANLGDDKVICKWLNLARLFAETHPLRQKCCYKIICFWYQHKSYTILLFEFFDLGLSILPELQSKLWQCTITNNPTPNPFHSKCLLYCCHSQLDGPFVVAKLT